MSQPIPNLPFPIRVECPPGACVCERGRLLAEPGADLRPLAIDRRQELNLIARIERVDTYEDLQHVQALICKNVGAELRIEPGHARLHRRRRHRAAAEDHGGAPGVRDGRGAQEAAA